MKWVWGWIAGALVMFSALPIQAQGPDVGATLSAAQAQATAAAWATQASVQQTRAAIDNAAAQQRATGAAIDVQQRAAAATSTAVYQQTKAALDLESAHQAQTTTAVANSLSAAAARSAQERTATAESLNLAATQQAQIATRQAYDGLQTETRQAYYAGQTVTAVQIKTMQDQAESDQRNRSLGVLAIGLVTLLVVVALSSFIWNQFRRVPHFVAVPVEEVKEETAPVERAPVDPPEWMNVPPTVLIESDQMTVALADMLNVANSNSGSDPNSTS